MSLFFDLLIFNSVSFSQFFKTNGLQKNVLGCSLAHAWRTRCYTKGLKHKHNAHAASRGHEISYVDAFLQMKLESGSLPLAVRDSEERLSKGGVYLLETGLQLFLWVGASVQQELLLNIFGTPSFSQIDGTMVS